MTRYDWYSDGGHGWLRVPLADLGARLVRVAEPGEQFPYSGRTLSGFSYVDREGYAYLEEDWDAGIFIRAMHEDGVPFETDSPVEHNLGRGESPVRLLPSITTVRDRLVALQGVLS